MCHVQYTWNMSHEILKRQSPMTLNVEIENVCVVCNVCVVFVMYV